MLQNLSSRIRYYFEKAAESRRRAAESRSPLGQRDFLSLENNWNTLARSEDFRERLERFLASRRDRDEMSRSPPVAEPSTFASDGDRGICRSGTRLVAIVEDDDSVREALEKVLCAFGYTAQAFATAEDYLFSDLMRDTACLISDVHLPGLSGPDLQVRLIADGHRIPIIFMTALFDETVAARVLQAGAIDCVPKPCNVRALLGCIEKAIERAAS
jgi:CheY-like chemotaxis protein